MGDDYRVIGVLSLRAANRELKDELDRIRVEEIDPIVKNKMRPIERQICENKAKIDELKSTIQIGDTVSFVVCPKGSFGPYKCMGVVVEGKDGDHWVAPRKLNGEPSKRGRHPVSEVGPVRLIVGNGVD